MDIQDKTLSKVDRTLLCNLDTLFHYTTYETFCTHIFLESRLRFSNIQKTHDPNEYKFVNVGCYNSDQDYEEIVKEAHKEVGQIRKHMCIGCFCKNDKDCTIEESFGETSPNCGFARSRMWSQYGQDHRGVCLAFNKQELITDIDNICTNKELFFCNPMKYPHQNKYDFNNFTNLACTEGSTPFERAKNYFKKTKNYKRLLYNKSIDYLQENEFRFAFYSTKDFEYVGLDSLTAIIVGDRFAKNTGCCQEDNAMIRGMLNVGKLLGVKVFRVTYTRMRPSIQVLKLQN